MPRLRGFNLEPRLRNVRLDPDLLYSYIIYSNSIANLFVSFEKRKKVMFDSLRIFSHSPDYLSRPMFAHRGSNTQCIAPKLALTCTEWDMLAKLYDP